VRLKGARTRDVRLPSDVTQFMKVCMEQVLVKQIKKIGCEIPLVQHLKRGVAFCYEEGGIEDVEQLSCDLDSSLERAPTGIESRVSVPSLERRVPSSRGAFQKPTDRSHTPDFLRVRSTTTPASLLKATGFGT